MSKEFVNLPFRLDDAMDDSWCQLESQIRVDLGFNLLNEDVWFNRDG